MAIGAATAVQPETKSIRVLVVDDSPAVQRLVTTVLNAEPNLQVVGVAGDGHEALGLLSDCDPEIVVLDLEMPGMDGPSTFAAMAENGTELAVVVFTGATPPVAGQLGAAIAQGRVAAVSKPTGVANLTDAFTQMRATLIPAITSALSSAATTGTVSSSATKPAASSPIVRRPKLGRPARIEAVVIGASTGGPDALNRFFSELSAPLPVPTFVVQHINAQFCTNLARRLDQYESTVVVANDGDIPQPGTVYFAPGGRHMVLKRDIHGKVKMRIIDTPPVNSCRPSVDVLFESTAEIYHARQLGIIMTGMGHDGLFGCEKLSEQKATILAQDPESSVIWGMPGAVVKADLADQVIPVSEMAQLVNRWLLPAGSTVASRAQSAPTA